jgi:hypothetical protein
MCPAKRGTARVRHLAGRARVESSTTGAGRVAPRNIRRSRSATTGLLSRRRATIPTYCGPDSSWHAHCSYGARAFESHRVASPGTRLASIASEPAFRRVRRLDVEPLPRHFVDDSAVIFTHLLARRLASPTDCVTSRRCPANGRAWTDRCPRAAFPNARNANLPCVTVHPA